MEIEADNGAWRNRSEDPMKTGLQAAPSQCRLLCTAAITVLLTLAGSAAGAAEDLPYTLAREGFFYVGGKPARIGGRSYMAGQMYVDFRIPANQTHPYPIIMVHGGTRSA